MKVYQVTTLAKPPAGNFSNFASLAVQESEQPLLGIGRGEFSGRPFSRKWKRLTLYIVKPRLPRADFFGTFSYNRFICNERVREIAGEPLEMSGEFLPVSIEGEKGGYWIYNCTNCINVVDRKKSKWTRLGRGKDERIMDKPAFIAERFGEESLFKIPEDNGACIYCLERTGDSEGGEFKAIVEAHGLTGLKFELMWSEKGT